MRPVTDRQARALRAVAASVLTTLFAATAHTLGGGGAPAPMVLLIAVLLSMPVALPFTGRRAGHVSIALAVIGSQAVYHLVFGVFGMSAVFAGPAVHVHDAMAVRPVAVAPVSAMDATAPLMGLFEPWMLAMHAAAALVAIATLRYGERLVRAVAGTIWPALVRRPFRALTPRALRLVVGGVPAPVFRALLSQLRGRAPPVSL